jgi:hypothetical protein
LPKLLCTLLVFVPRAPMMTGSINTLVTSPFHTFGDSYLRSVYFSIFVLSLSFTLVSNRQPTSTIIYMGDSSFLFNMTRYGLL